jgi:ubiquitin-protein ligase
MFVNRIVRLSLISKYLQKFCPTGIYILPRFDDIKIWDGVIFIREGYYKEGIFKFEILIPQNYPSKPPEVNFITKVFHPLIDLSTGKLDLSVK